MTTPLLLLGAAFLLILANGFFVAAEFGLVTVEKPDAERAAAEGDRRARTVVEALRELSFQLSGTQLGITLTSLVVGMLAEPALAQLLAGPLTAAGLPAGAVPGVGVVVGMLLASAVQMVVGELVPKNWAVSRPLQVARFVAGPQARFAALLRPVITLLNALANRLVRLLGVEPTDGLASARTPGELVSLARHSAEAGALEQDTADLFVRTLSLAGLTAQHVMTPRVKVSALHSSATAEDVLNLTRATGLSRFPVYRDRIDEVIGTVHLKDALAVPAPERLRTPAGRIAVPPLLVPGTLPVEALLRRLRHEQPIAVVVDEYGGTAGVVTLEDIIEELVGEVRDEHDTEGAGRPELTALHPLGFALALLSVIVLHLVIGEMVPKNLAMAAPERTALWLSPGLVAFARLCRPVTTALGACAGLVLRLFGVEPKDEVEAVFTSEQLNRLVEDSGQAGLLGPEAAIRLEDALELGSRPVADVLLEWASLVTVDPSVTPRRIEALTVRTGFSRFPLCADGGGPFMGYLHVKDVLELEDPDRVVPQQIWRPMATVRAELPLDDALTVMRRAATHLAQVADASGRILGLVAMEDVLETLVGEVRDPAHRTVSVPRRTVDVPNAPELPAPGVLVH